MKAEPKKAWYAVRCIFKFNGHGEHLFEERITLWRTVSAKDAITRAETEAREYAGSETGFHHKYLGLAQAYQLDGRPRAGAEVFSLLRESDLPEDEYIDVFFSTGTERQDHL